MPTVQELENLGRELRSRRIAKGIKSLRQFARQIGVSPTYLSRLERGYVNPKQGLVVPSDEVIEKLAEGLDIPLSRLHVLLGRMPDHPYPSFQHPEALQIAERYDQLPDYARVLVEDMIGNIEKMVLKHQPSFHASAKSSAIQ